MAKENVDTGSPRNAPAEATPQEKTKAQKWFDHGRVVADTHNYDYAIECYINGLAIWPEAVDEGHKPLRAVAFARLGAGRKKRGLFDRFKRSAGGSAGKDALQAMLAAEKLLAEAPNNIDYMEHMLKHAYRGGYENTCLWLGPLLLEQTLTNPKVHHPKLSTLCQVFSDLGERYNGRSDFARTVECLELALKAAGTLVQVKPDDKPIVDMYRNLAGRLTITKGKFEIGDFRESLQDAQKQKDLLDQQRLYKDDAHYAELIASGMKALEANPNEMGKVFHVVDLMLKRGRPADEEAAIRLLLDAHSRSGVYQFKARADDIRIRQLHRRIQEVRDQGDRELAQEYLRKMLDYEIGIYKERVAQYPTEGRHKHALGRLYFQAQRYDDAIPVLQQVRGDPKYRFPCLSLIAQCFFHKGYFQQAINILLDAIRDYDVEGDDLDKELHYWLSRSHEACGQRDEAMQAYGRIIQWDYNYRDVRHRLESLQRGSENGPGQPPAP